MREKPFKRILNSMAGYKTSYFVGIIGLSILQVLFQISIALLFLELFDTLSTGTFSELLEAILPYIIIMFTLILIFPLFIYLSRYSVIKTTGKIRKDAFYKLTRLPLVYHKNHHSAETISRLTNDITETERAYSEHMLQFLVNVISGVGSIIAMLFIDWRIALVPIVMGLITYLINAYYSKRLRTVGKEVQEKLATLNTKLSNLISGIHVIRIFNIQRHILNKFIKTNDDTHEKSIERVNALASINAVNDFIFTISFAGIGLFGAYLILEGFTTIGVIVAIIQLQNGVTQLVRVLGNFMANLQQSLAAAERVYDLMDEEEEPDHYQYDELTLNEEEVIKIEDLRFGYEEERLVINDLNLTVKANQTVAIVGPSGGGKSTLFKLLLQFYPPLKGKMAISDQPLNKVTLPHIRGSFAYVPQDAHLFNASVYENITFGNPLAPKELVISAAKMANAHDFIMQLEHGYDTIIGEQGTNLSGGQRQRIAIARAIIKKAPVYLLDEATSALDNESEKLVQNALETLMESSTSIVIAHRLSTIEKADLIVVMDQGKIVESGNHQTLMQHENGIYKGLYETQLIGK
jgi:ATP-binding cassette subfamily B protein